jgi:hypothetical protein
VPAAVLLAGFVGSATGLSPARLPALSAQAAFGPARSGCSLRAPLSPPTRAPRATQSDAPDSAQTRGPGLQFEPPAGLGDVEAGARRLREWLRECGDSDVVLVSGAGLSTESGIPDYRSPAGSYSKGHRPMQHDEFVGLSFSRAPARPHAHDSAHTHSHTHAC